MAALIDIIDQPKKTFKRSIERPRAWMWPAIWIVASILVLTLITSAQASAYGATQSQFTAPGMTGSTTGADQAQRLPQGQIPSGQSGAPSSGNQNTAPAEGQSFPTAGQTAPSATGSQAFPGGAPAGFPGAAALPSSPVLAIALKLGLLVISWLIIAGLGFLLVRLLRGKVTFKAVFTVGVLATIPFFYRNLTQLIYYWTTKRLVLSQGLSFLAPAGRAAATGSAVLASLLANIDPFSIWFYILLGIGLGTISELKGWQAALVTVILVAALAGIRLIPLAFNPGFSIPVLG